MSQTIGLTTDYGLTQNGFVRMRLPEIRAAIIADLTARLGFTFDTDPSSITGQFVDVFAEREAIAWEQAELVHLSMYPESASGVALDMAVGFAGVSRLQAQRGAVRATMRGTPGTEIPAGAVAQIFGDTVNRLLLFTNVILSTENASWARYQATGTSASVRIDGVTYSSAPGLASPADAAASLASVIDGITGLSATAAGDFIEITSDDDIERFFDQETNLTLVKVGSPGEFRSENFATFSIPAGVVTVISSPVYGWDSVLNAEAGSPGRQRESDADLRRRYRTGVYRLGAGTMPSIRATLEQIEGVSRVRVFENTSGTTDSDGRPPHSVEVVVSGGADAVVARAIYDAKGAGIHTYGLDSETVQDAYGIPVTVNFTRPAPVYIWLEVTLTAAAEETLPQDYVAMVKAAIVAAGAGLEPGGDVFRFRMAAAVSGIAGIASAEVETGVGTIDTPPGSYAAADVAIGPRERAEILEAHITVVGP